MNLERRLYDLTLDPYTEHKRAGEPSTREIYSGWASTPHLDTYYDIVEPGAFDDTVQIRFKAAMEKFGVSDIKFYREHVKGPVAVITDIQPGPGGLRVSWKFLSNSKGRDCKIEVDEGAVNKLSIGYRILKSRNGTLDGKKVRYLEKVDLYEISLVDDPANYFCAVDSKNESSTDANEAKGGGSGMDLKSFLMQIHKMCGDTQKMCRKYLTDELGCAECEFCEESDPREALEMEEDSNPLTPYGKDSTPTHVDLSPVSESIKVEIPAQKADVAESLQKTTPDSTNYINGLLESLQDMTKTAREALDTLEVKHG